ncbi:EscU/YscU/HrcU family type III secretion system export apparatus switch protein [bacterium]|nr:EscU/YscU/HrcU family type III secretion system export apparatus switch protein [bacterium]
MLSKRVAAIKYVKEKDRAPKLVAKGRGYLAEKILEAAHAHDVPIQENEILVSALDVLDLNTEIPPELYKAVAEVLAWVYRLENIDMN